MFRLILTQAKKSQLSIDLSAVHNLKSCKKVSFYHWPLQIKHSNSVDGNGVLSTDQFVSCNFEHRTRRFSFKICTFPSVNVSFSRNHASDASIGKLRPKKMINKKESVDIIDELNKIVANGNRLSHFNLKTLLNHIKTQKHTAEQVLNILRLCSFGCINQNVSDLVKSIWHELHSKNAHQFQTQHYNFLLKFAGDQQDVNFTQAIFNEMIANGIEPNVISYEHLLSVHCKAGNMKKTTEILNKMEQNQLPISEGVYNYMIQCNIVCGNVNDANKTIQNASKNGFRINRDTLTTLLNYYAKASDLENCHKTIAMFQKMNVELLNHDIFNVMCHFAVNGHADQCESLFQYFKRNAEMQTALCDALTLFVQNNQSIFCAKIMGKLMRDDGIAVDIDTIYKNLIQEMCRYDTPEHEFNATIDWIETNGFPIEQNFDMFKPALKGSSAKLIRRLLTYVKVNGLTVTEMAFEKLFELSATETPSSNADDILKLVDSMCVDFKIQPSVVYIRDVILPAILQTIGRANNEKGSLLVMAAGKLRKTKIHHYRTMGALINSSLNQCDFKTATHLMNNYQYFYAIPFITETLLNAYASSDEAHHFVEILKIICQSFSKINNSQPHEHHHLSDDDINQRKQAFIDEMLNAAVARTLADDGKRLTKLLEAFVAAGNDLIISPQQIRKIQQQLSEMDLNFSGNHLLQIDRSLKNLMRKEDRKLSSLHLGKSINLLDRQHLSAAELKQTRDELHGVGRDVAATEKRLFLAYLREENIPEVDAMLSGANTYAGKLYLTNANYSTLVDLYTRHRQLDKALNMLKLASKHDSTFKFNSILLAKVITLMYDQRQFEDFKEIYRLLDIHCPHRMNTPQNILFEKLLQRLAADGHTQYVQQLFDALVEFNYMRATPQTTGPLITVHLNNGKYDLAVEKYRFLAETFKFLPMSTVLFQTLIQHEQNDLLECAFNVCHQIYGKSVALSYMAFAYSACGQTEKAKQIFQSNCIADVTADIRKMCIKYGEKCDYESAKMLLESTDGIAACEFSRRIIYQTILDIYCKCDMADAALELWTGICNDNVIVTSNFINELAKLLNANHIELPHDLQAKIKKLDF